MKKIVTLLFLFTVSIGFSQEKKATKSQIVEAACGQCKFGMTGKSGCDLAVKIDNKTYFVDGTTMNEHGNAHAADGMCSAVRKAEAVGEIKGDRFVATSFKLLPTEGHDEHEGHKH